MRLPKLEFEPAPEWQRERLARWLADWAAAEALAGAELETTEPGDREGRPDRVPDGCVASVSEEPALGVGQIRLLAPDTTGPGIRPVFVAVLGASEDGLFLAAPFSPFAEPADEGELLTGRDEPPVRVLCVWNTRAVDSCILGNSWLVGDLSEQELESALALYRCLEGKSALPVALRRQIGPPVSHPADLRVVHRDRERALMDGVTAGPSPAVQPSPYPAQEEPRDLLRAAEPEPPSYETDGAETAEPESEGR